MLSRPINNVVSLFYIVRYILMAFRKCHEKINREMREGRTRRQSIQRRVKKEGKINFFH